MDTMTKQEILKALKESCSIKRVRLPNPLNMEIKNNCLIIDIPSDRLLKNMQTDSAAFEGWALVLKRWIKEINTVKIRWQEPIKISPNEMQHYQRFLYRAKRFSDAYNWVEIDNSNKSCVNLLKIKKGENLLINAPSGKRPRKYDKRVALESYSESKLEEFILTNEEVKSVFKQSFYLDILDNQLPVGVFKDKISNKTKIFTGGKSAIDIWGINKNNEFCLFELKNSENRKVGALSEMLFYSFLIQDVLNGVIKYVETTHDGVMEIKNTKKVKCFLLAPFLHPLIDKDVISLMNKSKSKIEYGNIKIESDFTFKLH